MHATFPLQSPLNQRTLPRMPDLPQRRPGRTTGRYPAPGGPTISLSALPPGGTCIGQASWEGVAHRIGRETGAVFRYATVWENDRKVVRWWRLAAVKPTEPPPAPATPYARPVDPPAASPPSTGRISGEGGMGR